RSSHAPLSQLPSPITQSALRFSRSPKHATRAAVHLTVGCTTPNRITAFCFPARMCAPIQGGTMARMRAVQVPSAKGPLQMVERAIPEPGAGWVRIRVEACGICHADSYVKEGLWPGIEYPRIPGHEVAGVIDAVGSGVAAWKPG